MQSTQMSDHLNKTFKAVTMKNNADGTSVMYINKCNSVTLFFSQLNTENGNTCSGCTEKQQ